MGPQADDIYEFGPYRLDIPEKLLSRDGVVVPLEPTQFQVLAVLVRAAGHLVNREALIHAVWKDTYVDEGSLTVTVSMLRRKLGDTPSQPRYIETVRKSGYRFVAPVRRQSQQSDEPQTAQSSLPPRPTTSERNHVDLSRHLGVASTVAFVAVLTGWFWSPLGVNRDPAAAAVPLYPFGGTQDDPSFSPDGSQIAFSWRPPQSDNPDIYVLRIGELNATRLTTDPALDKSPAWSPDGRQIAFIRSKDSKAEVLLISPAGGPEQKVVDTRGTLVTWSPDSQTLAFVDRAAGEDRHSIFLAPAGGGAKRRVTFPAAEANHGDSSPAISPDGRTLAFVRQLTHDVADVFVQPVAGGNARQLTFDKRQIRGLAWMSGGRELIFSSNRNGRHELWRLAVSGTAPAKGVEGIADARSPAISSAGARGGSRLVYQSHVEDYNIRVLHRSADGTWDASQSSSFAASTRDEQCPRVSPDGRRLAFVSDRSGWFEVWVCAYPEASDCRQLTSFRQGFVGSPRWSPDSKRIVFDARADGNADVYLVRAEGGQPVRLTYENSVDSRPTWSGDGRWIYFRSDRTGAHQIWKMPLAGGGAATQVTVDGGYEALESTNGKSLYYVQARWAKGLWTVPVDGGQAARITAFQWLSASSWTLVDGGILWLDVTKSNPPGVIRFYDPVTEEMSKLAEVPAHVIASATGLHAARDGTVIMWSQLDRSAHDLMLVERFR